MWVLTRRSWPTLVNLSSLAAIAYQQPSKSDPHVRVVGAAWEQEHVLADCADGEAARALVGAIAAALADGRPLLDLNAVPESAPRKD